MRGLLFSPGSHSTLTPLVAARSLFRSSLLTESLEQAMTTDTSFPRVFFQLLQYSRQRPSFSAYKAAPRVKTDLILPAFSSRFVDFEVQFCFRCKFSLHEERCSSQVCQWRDFPRPITSFCYPYSVTNEITSFCIDNR